jgi:hypothetical protein
MRPREREAETLTHIHPFALFSCGPRARDFLSCGRTILERPRHPAACPTRVM